MFVTIRAFFSRAASNSTKSPGRNPFSMRRFVTWKGISIAGILMLRSGLSIASVRMAGVRAVMAIGLVSSDARGVTAALRRMPAVARLHSTNGRWDLIAEVLAADLAELDAVLAEIRALASVANSETSILLRELK